VSRASPCDDKFSGVDQQNQHSMFETEDISSAFVPKAKAAGFNFLHIGYELLPTMS
jgi:hypothetical protein